MFCVEISNNRLVFECFKNFRSVKFRLSALMLILLLCDVYLASSFYRSSSRHSTFYTWILFEFVSMLCSMLVTIGKYCLHLVDSDSEQSWTGKAAYLFYLDLSGDLLSMGVFLGFMGVFFVQNPSKIPIYMMADILQVAKHLTNRLRNFRKYRLIMQDFDSKFRKPSQHDCEVNPSV